MRTLLLFLVVILITGCSGDEWECGYGNKKRGSVPNPPHGTPDHTSSYVDGDYHSVDYTYYCHNGSYITETYTSTSECSEWENSTYTSSGICN